MELSDIPKIFSGFKNFIFKNEKIESVAEERLKRCFTCENRKENKCGLCGCFLNTKTRSPNTKCPIDKW